MSKSIHSRVAGEGMQDSSKFPQIASSLNKATASPNVKDLFLVTTALQDTWPENNKSVLFLGEWCLKYSQRDELKN